MPSKIKAVVTDYIEDDLNWEQEQMAKAGFYPDVVIACCGGGSNFGGTAFPFAYDKIVKGAKVRLLAVEPSGTILINTHDDQTYLFSVKTGEKVKE